MDRVRLAGTLRSLGLGALGFVVTALTLAPADEPIDPSRPVSHAATLIQAHDCWTGEAPARRKETVPGHVVVTLDGTTRYAGDRITAMALEQLFGGVDHGLTVHGFCP